MATPATPEPGPEPASDEELPDTRELARHFSSTRRLVALLLGAESLGEDAEQDVILAALRRPPRIEKGFRAWFRGAVRKRRLHLRRSHAQRAGHELRALEARPGSLPGEPHAAVVRAETHERLVAAVMSLPEPYRTPIVLRYLEEYDTREVAEELGRPLSTTQTQLQRGLALLRERLSAEDRRGGGTSTAALSVLLVPHPASLRRRIESLVRNSQLAGGGGSGWIVGGGLAACALVIGGLVAAHLDGTRATGERGIEGRGRTPGAVVAADAGAPGSAASILMSEGSGKDPGRRVAGSTQAEALSPTRDEFGHRVQVEVTSAFDGSALNTAVAFLETTRDITASSPVRAADRARASRADETGVVSLTLPTPAPVWVRLEAEGHVGTLLLIEATADRLPIQLAVAAELRVESREGVILHAAKIWPVESFPVALPPIDLTPIDSQHATRKEAGNSARCFGAWLAPGSYVVSAIVERDGERCIDSALVELRAGVTTTWRALDAEEPDLLVSLSAGGAPGQEWSVMLLLGDSGQASALSSGRPDETLRLRSVPPGRHQLRVRLGDTELPRLTVVVGPGPFPTEISLELPAAQLSVTLECLDPREADPLLLLVGPLDTDGITPRTFSSRGHGAIFPALDPGRYEAWTRSPSGVGRTEVRLVEGDNHLVLEHEHGASARFTYTSPAPHDGHEVVLVTSTGVRLPLIFGREANSAPTFEVAGKDHLRHGSSTFAVPPGDYILESTIEGEFRRPRAVSLSPGAAVELDSGAPLAPVTLIVTHRGQPVANQLVELAGHLQGASPLDATRGPLWMLSGVTSRDGRWVTPLAPALWTATLSGGETVSFETTPETTTMQVELGGTPR